MSEWLEKFFQATDWREVVASARELSVRDDPADVPRLLAALSDPIEARRWGAVYALGFSRRDERVVSPLIRVLLEKRETPWVRAQAAECLGMPGKRKAIQALIECSKDESAEVRFWCVFAMGQCRWRGRGRKPLLAAIRALEARLGDSGSPDDRGDYWSVGLEALAMLRGTGARHAKMFRETMLSILKDPMNHRDQWQWAASYWDSSDAFDGAEARSLFDAAVRTIHDAGFDPVVFGRERQTGESAMVRHTKPN